MMTVEQLVVFVAVAEREHLTRAAEALRLTPSAVSSALRKLEAGGKARARLGGTPAEVSSAYQSLYIAAPFGGLGGMGKLFSTHPATEDRVANLVEIARRMGQVA